ncbi:TetR/AcrR family transcriptional regulator [Bacillus sp. EB600]|uniref:TetR/AcrR family transcriptional regulator n=1 Tax=Bacillus sp. EB600 TaxID=2806345 RepID=UPI00210DA2E4|nr:TetR/AcrR family transcriptional regulator [Bacillus sp. EB600]MCQ6280274.1 TetR/AcrR family transcriptional regulator [Bacillus sp. EB600]
MENSNRSRSPGRPKAVKDDKPTKEVILHTATFLFLQNGFQKVSVDEIAKEAGMTKATVYYYFETKAELFKEAMVALMGRIKEQINLLLSSDKPLYERLLDVAIAHLQSTASLDLEGFMRESRTVLTNDQVREMKLAEENMFVSIEQAFLEAIENGEIPKVHAKFAAHSYIALAQVGNYKQTDGASFFSTIEETADNILTVFWRGFFGDLL